MIEIVSACSFFRINRKQKLIAIEIFLFQIKSSIQTRSFWCEPFPKTVVCSSTEIRSCTQKRIHGDMRTSINCPCEDSTFQQQNDPSSNGMQSDGRDVRSSNLCGKVWSFGIVFSRTTNLLFVTIGDGL